MKKSTQETTKKIKKTSEKVGKKTKESAKWLKDKVSEGAEKGKKMYNSPRGKKVREWIKKTSKVIGSHLATVKAGITLSNEEANLLESLKNDLIKKNIYPSKSEILRAGLWSLRKMNSHDLEEALKDLIKVKQTRIL